MNIKEELKSFISGDVLDDEKTIEKYSRDASLFEIRPSVVVFPKDVSDIKKLVTFVGDNKDKKLSIAPRCAGTDMTGGPLTESVVLEFDKYFNHINEVGNDYAVTEPGVLYRDFEEETLKKDLLFPSYPASRESCAMGGIVANNSGGEKSLSYGKTENYVEELNVVLKDGNEYTLSPLNKSALEEKMKLDTFEGEAYRKVYELLDKNYELLQKARPQVSKNSAGYYLWNIWDKKTFDLTKLFVGSQGTLGIITKIKLRLIKPKKHSKLLVIFLKDLDPLPEVINKILKHKPESFESYDDSTFKLILKYLPDVIKFFKNKNIFSLAWQFLPEAFMVLTGGMPKMVLLAEFTGDSEEEIDKIANSANAELAGLDLKSRVTKSEAEARKYWVTRRESFNLLRHHITDRQTAPFIDDITVRPGQLPEFLPKLRKIMNEYKLTFTIAGHIGDANFHIIPLMDLSDERNKEIIFELAHKVYALVHEFGGSISGEHNDGIIRAPFLEDMYGSEVYNLFKETKKIFDPDGIFNPGKKTEVLPMEYMKSHLREARIST